MIKRLNSNYRFHKVASRRFRNKYAAAMPGMGPGPWWQTSWKDPWCVLGAASTSAVGGAAGYSLGNAIASKLGWDENGFGRKALRTVLGAGGMIGGAYLGKWGMIPFNAGGRLGNYLTPRLGKWGGMIAGMGAGMVGSAAYGTAVDGTLNSITDASNRAYMNSTMSANDFNRYVANLKRMNYENQYA